MIKNKFSIIPYVLFVIVLAVYLYGITEIKKENKLLEKDGVIIKGVYYSKIDRLSKPDIYKYEFFVNGVKYNGTYETRDFVNTQDSVEIIYYKFNPEINQIAIPYKSK
jgi:hypothetical protein